MTILTSPSAKRCQRMRGAVPNFPSSKTSYFKCKIDKTTHIQVWMQLSKEEYARKRIHNGSSVQASWCRTVTLMTQLAVSTSQPLKILVLYPMWDFLNWCGRKINPAQGKVLRSSDFLEVFDRLSRSTLFPLFDVHCDPFLQRIFHFLATMEGKSSTTVK